MDDRERAEMQALLDQFREAMARENAELLFDQAAKVRIGEAIGKAARQPRSDHVALHKGWGKPC